MDVPQFPVAEQDKKIEVGYAADGSGKVEFSFDSVEVVALTDTNHNTDKSIPAGIVAADAHSVELIYKPDGDMGAGEFDFRMPSGWSAADILTEGDTNTTPSAGEVESRNYISPPNFLKILGRLWVTH